jgi:hypothetical protein
VTNRYERLKMQRQMQRRIRLVVEERRISRPTAAEPAFDPEATVEIPPPTALRPAPVQASPLRAIGRVAIRSA